MIKTQMPQELRLGLRIIMLGDTNVGKSTLIGVLVNGINDDGKGKARMNVFKYKHEVYQGTTSSLTHQILAFNAEGKIITQSVLGVLDWNDVVHNSYKFINFIDVSGQKKYNKTMLSGICGHEPDYALIIVDALKGVTQSVKEYIKMAKTMQVPFLIVITKIDKTDEMQLLITKSDIQTALSDPLINTISLPVNGIDDVILYSKNMKEGITPIIDISNVTKQNMELFSNFLNMLPPSGNRWSEYTEQCSEFHISDLYIVNKEIVFGGIVYRGKIRCHQQLLLGPDNKGKFRKVEVKSLKCLKVFVQNVVSGQICTIAVNFGKDSEKFFNKINSQFRKGIVLVQPNVHPIACRKFDCELITLDGKSKTISSNYQPLIYTDHIRQTAQIILDPKPDNEVKASHNGTSTSTPIVLANNLQEQPNATVAQNNVQNPTITHDSQNTVPIHAFLPAQNAVPLQNVTSTQSIGAVQEAIQNTGITIQSTTSSQNETVIPQNVANISISNENSQISNSQVLQLNSQSIVTAQPVPNGTQDCHQSLNIDSKTKLEEVKSPSSHVIAQVEQPILISGDQKIKLCLQFMYYPEYIAIGHRVVIHDANLQAIGKITKVFYETE